MLNYGLRKGVSKLKTTHEIRIFKGIEDLSCEKYKMHMLLQYVIVSIILI